MRKKRKSWIDSDLRRFHENAQLALVAVTKYLADKESAVDVVDGTPSDGDIGGREQLEFPEEFPAGEIQDETNTGPEFSQFKMPRQAEIGQELTQLTTERETYKPNQKLKPEVEPFHHLPEILPYE